MCPSITCFTPQMGAMAKAEMIQSWEPGNFSLSPTLAEGPKDQSHSLLPFQAMSRSWIRSGAAEVRTAAMSLACYKIVLDTYKQL